MEVLKKLREVTRAAVCGRQEKLVPQRASSVASTTVTEQVFELLNKVF